MASDVAPVSDALNALHYRRRISNLRLARLAGVSEAVMSRARSEDYDLKASHLQALSVALCDEGVVEIAEAFLSDDYVVCRRGEGRQNGSLGDEAIGMFEAFGAAAEAFERGDETAGRAALARAQTVLSDAHAEFDARAAGSIAITAVGRPTAPSGTPR